MGRNASRPPSAMKSFIVRAAIWKMRSREQLLDLHADRTSSHFMASNQLRLWLSTFAYLLLERLRTLALQKTVLERATAGTIRLRLLKIGALITVSVRRVYVRLASAFALKELFEQVLRALRALPQEAR